MPDVGNNNPPIERPLFTVREVATVLGASESWVRRHAAELPVVRLGRLVRFDSRLLERKFHGIHADGNSLRKPERIPMLRRYQQGSVYKAGKRIKMWYGRFREDVRTPEGGIIRRTRNVRLGSLTELPTRSAAKNALSKLLGKPPSAGMTFAELVERWKSAIVPTIKATTADYYQETLEAHIIPVFGQRQISSISRYDVESFLAERASTYCRNTLRGMRVSLGRVLSWAVACEWIEKNSCSGVKLPRAKAKITRTVLKPEQVTALASKLKEPYSTLVLFLAVTGLRIGEAIAVKWSDFEGDVLHVCRRIYEGEIDTPKTKGSERSLPIPEALLSRMRALPSSQDGWVFCSRDGTPVNPGNMMKRHVRPAAQKLGITLSGWHDLRHSLVTQLRKCGWAAKVVSEIVGHSTPHITEAIYDHADRDDFRAALDEIAGQLLPNVTKCTSNGAEPKTEVLQ